MQFHREIIPQAGEQAAQAGTQTGGLAKELGGLKQAGEAANHTLGGLSQGQTTIKLAVPSRERDWWQSLWEKLLSPHPNCNAVGTRPRPA